MKKEIMALAAGLVLAGGTAWGETTLVVTETLEPAQVGVDVSYTFQHQERHINEGGKEWRNTSAADFALGIGLIPNLEIDFDVPYVFSDRVKSEFPPGEFSPPLQYSGVDGVGDFSVGARYAIIAPKGEGFRLATGVDLKFDTGDRGVGTGTTDVAPIIAASYQTGMFKPYIAYQPTLRNNGAPDTHDFSIGSHIRLGDGVILNPKFNVGFSTATDSTTSFEDYSLRLSGYFRLMKGLYLTTSARVNFESPFQTLVPTSSAPGASLDDVRYNNATAFSGSIGFYFEY